MFRPTSSAILCCCVLLSAAPASFAAPERGYLSRTCGFDLNDNGIRGEADDCKVCNGLDGDPDGDGVVEDLIYVNCDSGADHSTCGSPANPCRTLEYVFQFRTDGHTDGAEDIVCVRGTCRPSQLQPSVRGLATVRTAPPFGSAESSFQYPTNPAMLVGWDFDQDGAYPPVDPDDRAVLDGSSGLRSAIHTNDSFDNSFFEIAHLTARNYNRFTSPGDGSFIKVASGRPSSSHLYLHDLALEGINQGQPSVSGTLTFDLFASQGFEYLAVENVKATNIGGYMVGGGPGNGPDTLAHARFANLDASALGCLGCSGGSAYFQGFKIWGYIDGVEIIDSRFDCNPSAWNPQGAGSGCRGVLVGQCVRNALVRNNELINMHQALAVQTRAPGFCDGAAARRVDEVTSDGNHSYVNWTGWPYHGFLVIHPEGAPVSANEALEDLKVINNSHFAEPNTHFTRCVYYAAGNPGGPNPGKITIANNQCYGNPIWDFGVIHISDQQPYKHEQWQVTNNVIAGSGTQTPAITFDYRPTSLSLDGNSYGHQVFAWEGLTTSSIATWRTWTSGDQNATICTPAFRWLGAGHLELRPDDGCALDRGRALAGTVPEDIYGTVRPQLNAWDRGPHEYSRVISRDTFDGGGLSAWSSWVIGAFRAYPASP